MNSAIVSICVGSVTTYVKLISALFVSEFGGLHGSITVISIGDDKTSKPLDVVLESTVNSI